MLDKIPEQQQTGIAQTNQGYAAYQQEYNSRVIENFQTSEKDVINHK